MNLPFTRQAAEATARAQAAEARLADLQAAISAGGLFNLTSSEEGKFSVALSDAGRAHFASELTALQAQVADATASVQSLVTEKGQLEAKLAAAVPGERNRLVSAVTEGKLFALAFDAEGKPALTLTDEGKTRFINAEAARSLAATGHAPLPLAVDNAALGNRASAGKTGAGRTKTTWNK